MVWVVTIGVNDNLDEHTRYLAVEMLWRFDGTAIEKLDKTILGRLFHLLILAISRVSSDRCDYMIAEEFAHTICRLRGVELEFDLVIHKLLSDMASKDWRKHYSAISVICINAQECPEAMSDNIPEVMKVISQSTSYPSPKIVKAALRTVYFLSVFLPRHTLEEHFDFIITVLQSALADGSEPDNQVLAASAMRSLSDHCSLFILEPHLETTVSKLLQLLQSEHAEVQEEALNTLSSFGKLSKETFGKCYDMVITCLKQHLAGPETNREQNCLSGSKRQA